jgi:hypothetical protein
LFSAGFFSPCWWCCLLTAFSPVASPFPFTSLRVSAPQASAILYFRVFRLIPCSQRLNICGLSRYLRSVLAAKRAIDVELSLRPLDSPAHSRQRPPPRSLPSLQLQRRALLTLGGRRAGL